MVCSTCGSSDGIVKTHLESGLLLCAPCLRAAKTNGRVMAALACRVCGARYPVGSSCPRCLVRERVGADVFECDCGARVDIADSVRMMRKGTGRIERVCLACSRMPTCLASEHHMVTPQHKDWEARRFLFEPVPDGLPVGYCAVCGLQQYWDGNRWARMTWTALADSWTRAGS